MKCKKDNVEVLGFTADTYPYESGFRCPVCGVEFSDLQMARGEHKKYFTEV